MTRRLPLFKTAILLHCVFSLLSHADDRALLIGIDKYKTIRPQYIGSTADLANMKEFTRKILGFRLSQIKTLADEEATHDNILATVDEWLVESTRTGDRVFFYYSGHGSQIPDQDEDEEEDKLDETFVSYDVENVEGHFINMVRDDELNALFSRIADRHTLIIVDSCNSGTITRGLFSESEAGMIRTISGLRSNSRSLGEMTRTIEYTRHRHEDPILDKGKQRIVWTSVSAAQLAFVDINAEPTQGVFTRKLIEGVRDKKADLDNNGVVSNSELLAYTRRESEKFCNTEPTCRRKKLGLTPTLSAPKHFLNKGFLDFASLAKPTPKVTDVIANVLPDSESAGNLSITLETAGKTTTTLHRDDKLFITINSTKGGHLLLLDRNGKGELTQLYPNLDEPDNRIAANQDVFIPKDDQGRYVIVASELGSSQIIAVVTHDPIHLDDLTAEHANSTAIQQPVAYLTELAQRLQQTWTGDETNRAVDYAIAKKDYTVIK